MNALWNRDLKFVAQYIKRQVYQGIITMIISKETFPLKYWAGSKKSP